jgi:hypothetical protein
MNKIPQSLVKHLIIKDTYFKDYVYDLDPENLMPSLVNAIQSLPISIMETIDVKLEHPITLASGNTITEFTVGRDGPVGYSVAIVSERTCKSFQLVPGEGHIGLANRIDYRDWKWSNGEPMIEMASDYFYDCISVLLHFNKQVQHRKLYPFDVTVNGLDKIKSKGKRNKASKNHNTVVYLSSPPSNGNGDGDGTAHEFGYPRIGHRRTLSHEIYSNHPKFQIYKGVWVSQAWCGPKEYIHRKRTYKLWEPSGFDVAGG